MITRYMILEIRSMKEREKDILKAVGAISIKLETLALVMKHSSMSDFKNISGAFNRSFLQQKFLKP